jgi:hypothetical protein
VPKKRLIVLVLIGIMSYSIPYAAAAVKAGDKCSTRGISKTVGKKVFICVKQGKKLSWALKKDNGTSSQPKQTSPTPSPSPSPTPTLATPEPQPTSSSTPTPSPTAIKEEVPEFLTISQPLNELAIKVAWKSFDKRNQQATSSKAKVDLRTGPNTDQSRASEYIESLKNSVAFWDDVYSPDKPVVAALAYSSDYSWMESQWKLFGLNPNDMGGESSFKQSGADCNQGSATLSKGVEPFFWGCLASRGSIDFIGVKKFAGHEYTHVVQSHLIEWKSGSYKRSALPLLFSEGSADFYGIASASKNQSEFLTNWNESRRRGFFGESSERLAIKSWNSDKWLFALNENAKNNQVPESKWVQYYSGRELILGLIGLKGHESFVSFMKKTESYQDWKKSFQEVYGLSWDEYAQKMSVELVEITKALVP